MQVEGNYQADGYALLRGLVGTDVCRAFLHALKADMGEAPIPLSRVKQHPNLLRRPAFELYGHHYPPMLFFLWGLTPRIAELVGRPLLPTYDYLRIYREGDVCRVHHDRWSCEHSLSLTLAYSDGAPWPLEVEKNASEPSARVEESFGPAGHASLSMAPGDGVLYRGVEHRHGRVTPNPNAWSAHLFLHWVDPEGPHRVHAFDGRMPAGDPRFTFA